ncbi:hypothetical protein [Sphingomonas cavernae]|uniref:Uncharacterized protein n=1 Tax=Sphingomonas cavernae TaxID=2320861 RepID=A0A418WN01_9SPHN|nr:hypothetical protein [Sphingomonas cavernae]RJF91378.1 hypothetical protein D3876_14875 [Sphingomonas cavernae]
MKHWQKFASSLAAITLACGPAHAAATADCVTGDEVKAIALVLLPEALDATAKVCASVLPATALLRKTDAPIFERYRVEKAPAMELARAAFARIAGLGDSDEVNNAGLELMRAMLVPQLSAEIKPADCGAINRMIELFEPLPPENMAGAIATILQIVAKEDAAKAKKKRKKSSQGDDLNICPFDEAR